MRAHGAGPWGSVQWVLAAACQSSYPGLPPASLEGWGDALNLRLSLLIWGGRGLPAPRGFSFGISERGEVCAQLGPVCTAGAGATVFLGRLLCHLVSRNGRALS